MFLIRIIIIAVVFWFVSRILQRMFGPGTPRRAAGASPGTAKQNGGRPRPEMNAVDAEFEELDEK